MNNLSNPTNQSRSNSDGKSESSGQTPTVHTAASECHQAVMDGGSIATQPAEQLPTGPGQKPAHDADVTLANTSRHTSGRVTVKNCEFCGNEMTVKRSSKKYCGNNCRQKAWLAAHPDVAEARAAAWREELRRRIESRGGTWVEQH